MGELLPDLTAKEDQKIYDTNMNVIKETLSKGKAVEIRNFGKFSLREKPDNRQKPSKSFSEPSMNR